MDKSEADKILLALDGLAANIETIRNLVLGSINPTKTNKLLDLIADESCQHINRQVLNTMESTNEICNDCGQIL